MLLVQNVIIFLTIAISHRNSKKHTIKVNENIISEREKLILKNKACKINFDIDIEKHKKLQKTTIKDYKLIKVIGKGAFGKVTLGVHKLTGKNVAIKSNDKNDMKDEFSKKKVFQEVYILKKIRHANVIRLLEVFEGSKQLFIVMEYAEGGDLLGYVKKKGRLSDIFFFFFSFGSYLWFTFYYWNMVIFWYNLLQISIINIIANILSFVK